MEIKAPAKINLHLAVLDIRPDGFHNLESLFIALDLCDILSFELKNGKKNTLDMALKGPAAEGLDIPAEKNIIFKALTLFREKTGYTEGLKIMLDKHIPVGGGLGGGSSDAASTLLALNQLAGFPLERIDLLEMGAILGSDVPFFLSQVSAAWITGRGEFIEPLEPPPWHFVLVNPGFPSDTAGAFYLLDRYRRQGLISNEELGVRNDKDEKLNCSNSSFLIPNLPHSLFKNDFLPVFPEQEKSTYNKIISQINQHGAEFASLSGTGSTCFGVFSDMEQAKNAALSLSAGQYFTRFCSVYRM